MKRIPQLVALLLVAISLALSGASCKKHYTGIPVAQLRQMTPFNAKVESTTVQDISKLGEGMLAVVWLKTEDGRRSAIGGERSKPGMVQFVQSLKDGETYAFPQVLLDFEKSSSLTVE